MIKESGIYNLIIYIYNLLTHSRILKFKNHLNDLKMKEIEPIYSLSFTYSFFSKMDKIFHNVFVLIEPVIKKSIILEQVGKIKDNIPFYSLLISFIIVGLINKSLLVIISSIGVLLISIFFELIKDFVAKSIIYKALGFAFIKGADDCE
jgi:hypothetical protein